MSVPIVCFVGKSNSGKTTFIERVIPELVRAGYKIATVKHGTLFLSQSNHSSVPLVPVG